MEVALKYHFQRDATWLFCLGGIVIFKFIILLFFSVNALNLKQVIAEGGELSQKQIENSSKKANATFDEMFKELADASPIYLSHLGFNTKNSQLDEQTEDFEKKKIELQKKWHKKLLEIDPKTLDFSTQITLAIALKSLEQDIESIKWFHHQYRFTNMFGSHSGMPTFMMTIHQVKNEKDLVDYISRLNQFERFFRETVSEAKKSEEKGIVPPAFTFDRVIPASENVIKGAPFDRSNQDSPLWADFKKKLSDLNLSSEKNKMYSKQAEKALQTSVHKAYRELLMFLKSQKGKYAKNQGVWALPDGKKYYEFLLKQYTTLDLSADEIYELGLKEVSRIHDEMKTIISQIGFKGSLQDFFKYISEDSKFYYPQTEEGKKAYLKKSEEILTAITKDLDKLFITKPKRKVEVKAVEEFREKSEGTAFYQSPPLVGDRPGVYYVNLRDMKSLPLWEMEALVHHETMPGHHLQLAIQSDLKNIPLIRKTSHFTSYIEGWGLYSEKIPKEIGFYKDPYSDFGRLYMELVRACRLVVDTGIHHKKWSYEGAIKYLDDNQPGARSEHEDQIQRYFVMPGQATAYKIGMNKILELRENSMREMGRAFNLREFHEVILTNGPVPLDILELIVNKYKQKNLKNKTYEKDNV